MSAIRRVVHVSVGRGGPLVVMLHGLSGDAEALAPFAKSLGLSGDFVFPEGPVELEPYGLPGRAWWPSDGKDRERAIATGVPRDLSGQHPPGLDEARTALTALLDEWRARLPGRPLVLGGFSQGAMLSLDWALRSPDALAGLVLLSGCSVAADESLPYAKRRSGQRFYQAHGNSDPDLSCAAALALHEALQGAGWLGQWLAFDGGHEVPLPAWRGLKRFLEAL
ncbi:MAG: alpha/beta fold hydrolase [Polyangiaceae bacterium]